MADCQEIADMHEHQHMSIERNGKPHITSQVSLNFSTTSLIPLYQHEHRQAISRGRTHRYSYRKRAYICQID